jgi:hypothetical protein
VDIQQLQVCALQTKAQDPFKISRSSTPNKKEAKVRLDIFKTQDLRSDRDRASVGSAQTLYFKIVAATCHVTRPHKVGGGKARCEHSMMVSVKMDELG